MSLMLRHALWNMLQSLQIVFTTLYFFHILLCYSLNLNGFNWDFVSLVYTKYPIMSKWNDVFYKLIKNKKLKCQESISMKPLSHPGRRELFMSLFLVWSGCDLGGHSMFMFLCFLFLCAWSGMVLNQGQLSIVVSDWESYLGSPPFTTPLLWQA
jgi:hypothetical protein